MTKETICQKDDTIISNGIKKLDSGYGIIFNIMIYYNKNFYNQESAPILIPEKYYQLVNDSQFDNTKLFFGNFISEPEEVDEFCRKEFYIEIYKIISSTFTKLIEKFDLS